MFHTIVSIKNDGHYFCRAGGNRPDGLNEPVTSDRVPVVFRLKDCHGPAQYSVKVTLTGTEDSGQPGFLALDDTSGAQGVGIGMETTDGTAVAINNTTGVTFVLNDGNNSLNFRAWLQAKEGRAVTPGNFTAQLTATFEYI